MKIIGVCGGSGSGKSTVSAILCLYGGVLIDADDIYHDLIARPSPCVDALVESFGKEILLDGGIDRDKLRSLVFADEKKRIMLNSISHRFVLDEIDNRIHAAEETCRPYVVIDAPLLFEAGLDERCDFILAVTADKEKRVQRIMERDDITKESALIRISKQIPDEELIRKCDGAIRNESSKENLKIQCRDLLRVLGLCKTDKE